MYQEAVTFISNIGFPIACCVAMFYMLRDNQKIVDKTLNEIKTAVIELRHAIEQIVGDNSGL